MDEGAKISERLRIESGEAFNQDAGNVNPMSGSASIEIDSYDVEEIDSDENRQLQLYDPEANLSLMQNMSDDHFLLVAEHLRVQKLVSSFALVVMDPAAGFLDGGDRHSTEQQDSPSSAMHRRVGVEEYLTPDGSSTGNLPGYQEFNRGYTSQNSNDFLSPDSQRPSSATPSRTPSMDPRLDGSSPMGGFSERRGSFQHVDRVEDYSESRDVEAESNRTGIRDRGSHDLIRFRFDIPSEDIWYPMVLPPDMKVSCAAPKNPTLEHSH